MTALLVGLSTCPNDTFLFHGLLTGQVDTRGLDLDFVLDDVQALNERMGPGGIDVTKASFAAGLEHADHYGVLAVGVALGFGVGPVLLGRPGLEGPPRTVLAPGDGTTATRLLRRLRPDLCGGAGSAGGVALRQVRFDAIMPALLAGEADAGVCIHEARFTYADRGLTLLEDLGASWEAATGHPVPLGGLFARHDLGAPVHADLNAALADSLALARRDPAATLPTMRSWAQELDDDVLWGHVELYVNARTADLGEEGAAALDAFAAETRAGAAFTILGVEPAGDEP